MLGAASSSRWKTNAEPSGHHAGQLSDSLESARNRTGRGAAARSVVGDAADRSTPSRSLPSMPQLRPSAAGDETETMAVATPGSAVTSCATDGLDSDVRKAGRGAL